MASVASGIIALDGLPSPAQPPDIAGPTTPVLSLRRMPELLARRVADGRLSAELANHLGDPALAGAAGQSCLLVHDSQGRPVFQHRPADPVIPASTAKLATALAAWERMGPEATFTTEVRSVPGGEDLWLVGGGDPLLATADFAAIAGPLGTPRLATSLEALADAVLEAGVTSVPGAVLGDESRHDIQRYVPTWNPSYASTPEIGPQSALTVNEGFTPLPNPRPSSAPATTAATIFTDLLVARGISVGGEPSQGQVPPEAEVVATVSSPPLADVLGVVLGNSNNLAAELITKELGFRFGAGGTTEAGIQVIVETLGDLGIPVTNLLLNDGSGLDRGDRVDCRLLQAILDRIGPAGPLGQALPVAAESGTLVRRMEGTGAAGRVRAKTGSLNGVAALSGFAVTAAGQALTFSLVANDLPPGGAGIDLGDRVAVALTRYPNAPEPATLAPLP